MKYINIGNPSSQHQTSLLLATLVSLIHKQGTALLRSWFYQDRCVRLNKGLIRDSEKLHKLEEGPL